MKLRNTIFIIIMFCFTPLVFISNAQTSVYSDSLWQKVMPKYANATKTSQQEAIADEVYNKLEKNYQLQMAIEAYEKFDPNTATAKECRILAKMLYWANDGKLRKYAYIILQNGAVLRDPFCCNLYAVYLYKKGDYKTAFQYLSTADISNYPPLVHNTAVLLHVLNKKNIGKNLAKTYLYLRANNQETAYNYHIDEYIYCKEGHQHIYNWEEEQRKIKGEYLIELYGESIKP